MNDLSWLFLYGLLSSYCLAGCLTEHFAIIRGWLYVAEEEFHDVHVAQGNGFGYVYVLPKIALTVVIGALLFVRPANMPLGYLWGGGAARRLMAVVLCASVPDTTEDSAAQDCGARHAALSHRHYTGRCHGNTQHRGMGVDPAGHSPCVKRSGDARSGVPHL